jgi:outer membrane biogenesis lipoprotein LolB
MGDEVETAREIADAIKEQAGTSLPIRQLGGWLHAKRQKPLRTRIGRET